MKTGYKTIPCFGDCEISFREVGEIKLEFKTVDELILVQLFGADLFTSEQSPSHT